MAREFFLLQGKLNKKVGNRVVNLSQGEMAMMGFFAYEKRETTPTELSTHFNLSTARVANTLNSLEKKGYVERVHDTVDRRRVTVHATKPGIDYFKERESEAIERFGNLVNHLGEEDAAHLNRIFHKLNEYFE